MPRSKQPPAPVPKRQAKQQVKAAAEPPAKAAKKDADLCCAKDKMIAFKDTRKSNKQVENFKIGTLAKDFKQGDEKIYLQAVYAPSSATDFTPEKVKKITLTSSQFLSCVTKASKKGEGLKLVKAEATRLQLLMDSQAVVKELPVVVVSEPVIGAGAKRARPQAKELDALHPVDKLKKDEAGQLIKVPKVAKKPTVFKLGKWNPSTEIIEKDTQYCSTDKSPLFDCCHRCNKRNLFRAVRTQNYPLLKNLVCNKDMIHNLHAKISGKKGFNQSVIEAIMEKGDKKMLEILLVPGGVKRTDECEYQKFYTERKVPKSFLLRTVEQGKVSFTAYGHAVRQVQMSRGNRQGNNAFEQSHGDFSEKPSYGLQQMADSVSLDMFKAQFQLSNVGVADWRQQVDVTQLALHGKREWLIEIVKAQKAHDNYGWNNLHLDVLTNTVLTEKYHTASLTKKCHSQKSITPIHLACTNPNLAIIKKLMEQSSDVNVCDTQNHKPLHFAAGCESVAPLEYLLTLGANPYDLNLRKRSALHFAALAGRPHNITALLAARPEIWKIRDSMNMSAFGYACESGRADCILAFLDTKVVKAGAGQGPDRISPLGWAALQGNFELCQTLIETYKARVMSKDKFKRIPLHHAVMNGHTRVASLLLQQGSDWNFPDSSGNTPLHYAAGFGHLQCVDLLMKHGAEINAENMWRTTPINIAMLCNHVGMVRHLLEVEEVDVNGKDERGQTLLSLSVVDMTDGEMLQFVEYLLDKGADPNIPDIEGNTALHWLANYTSKLQSTKDLESIKKEKQNCFNMMDLLLKNGADLTLLNKQKESPFILAVKQENIQLLQMLSESVYISKDPLLIFAFEKKIFDARYRDVLVSIIDREANSLPKETLNVPNATGFSAFLAFIQAFVTEGASLQQKVKTTLIENIVQKKGKDVEEIEITNEMVFAGVVVPTQNAFGAYQFNQVEHGDFVEKQTKILFFELIVVPFLDFLKILVFAGADPHACVDKTEFYRELDIKKLEIMALQQKEDENMIDGSKPKLSKKKSFQAKEDKKSPANEKSLKKKILQQLKEFYTEKCFTAKFEKGEDGNEYELEYQPQFGKQNAIHLAMRMQTQCEILPVIKYLIETCNISCEAVDYMGRNPFLLRAITKPSENFDSTIDFLLQQDSIRVDMPDQTGKTPVLHYYKAQNMWNMANVQKLLELGADINHMDNEGQFLLKFALIRRDESQIARLVEQGADINKLDNKGRNLLHIAVNMSSATADATFETEQQLIDLGVNINQKDYLQRVPLHYSFVKINNWDNKTQIDPIETVSSLCGQPGLALDEADKWNMTPLHYAAMRGASISSMYMVARGAKLENVDVYGNTPLATALLNSHFNYCILIIKDGSDVTVDVTDPYPKHIEWQRKKEQEWLENIIVETGNTFRCRICQQNFATKDAAIEHIKQKHEGVYPCAHCRQKFTGAEALKNHMLSKHDIQNEEQPKEDELGRSLRKQKQHRRLFSKRTYYSQFQIESDSDNYSSEESEEEKVVYHGYGRETAPRSVKDTDPGKLVKRVRSTFKIAVQSVQQGLAYMILDNGYNYMRAMQDAMDEAKFQLVVTLLSKTADNSIVQAKNDKEQNLIHILAQNAPKEQLKITMVKKAVEQNQFGGFSSGFGRSTFGNGYMSRKYGGFGHAPQNIAPAQEPQAIVSPQQTQANIERIYTILKKRGVSPFDIDSTGSHALHYAVERNCFYFVDSLLKDGAPVNTLTKAGHSPLSLFMGQVNALTQHVSQTAVDVQRTVFDLLVEQGAALNICYPEKRLRRDHLDCQKEDNGEYRCTPLVQCVRQFLGRDGEGREVLSANMDKLVGLGAEIALQDSEGRSPLMYAVMSGDEKLVEWFVAKHSENAFDVNQQDSQGKSVAHYIVSPLPYGTYDNCCLTKLQKAVNLKVDLADAKGNTPLDMALHQRATNHADQLQKLGQKQTKSRLAQEKDKETWPATYFDFTEDAKALVSKAEAKEEAARMQVDEKNFVPVDVTIPKDEIQYKVYYTAAGKPYDCYLNKVDLKNGRYGDYVFYKLQMLHDTNRDLYIVLTRYGRIGETGMHQRSPFPKLEDAIAEFHMIFKQKSGGDFGDLENFVAVKGKYSPVKVSYSSVKHQDLLGPFDWENANERKVVSKPIGDLIEEVSSVTMFRRVYAQLNLDQDLMPISKIEKESLDQAASILEKLKPLIKQLIDLVMLGLNAPMAARESLTDEVIQASSEYYKLIPMSCNKDSLVRPIAMMHEWKRHSEMIEKLRSIEISSRMLMGALFREKLVNPADYIYSALQTRIELMQAGDPETELIRKFVTSTGQNMPKFKLYRVERRGEAERFAQHEKLENRRLLFHGSQLENYLGILKQGLRVCPTEAPTTGYALGKGIYFADTFNKAKTYSQNYFSSSSSMMVLAEVALGNIHQTQEYTFTEACPLPKGKHSLEAMGIMTPDPEKQKVMTPQGFSINFGPTIRRPTPESHTLKVQEAQQAGKYMNPNFYNISDNEFVVYNPDQVRIRYLIQFS